MQKLKEGVKNWDNLMAVEEGVSVLGKRSTHSSDTEDSPEEKKRKIMKEIELSLPLELSKTQRKKQIKLQYKEIMKKEWRYDLNIINLCQCIVVENNNMRKRN